MASDMEAVREPALYSLLLEVRDRLRSNGDRLVLAESCTAGLVAAELGQIPGISEFLCGSMVVYRTETKREWLGIDASTLNDPTKGPVSPETSVALATAVLDRTPEATLAAAITGHLGPASPIELDGRIYCAFARRIDSTEARFRTAMQGFQLKSPAPLDNNDLIGRRTRQIEAVRTLLEFVLSQA
jgi:nicotinamide-nucleotide amidase